jgi:hypothetical protein
MVEFLWVARHGCFWFVLSGRWKGECGGCGGSAWSSEEWVVGGWCGDGCGR